MLRDIIGDDGTGREGEDSPNLVLRRCASAAQLHFKEVLSIIHDPAWSRTTPQETVME